MDEAMHPLTLLCFGLYGEVLPNQNGAPVRTVIPWKYGFKSIKSIVQSPLRREAAGNHLEQRQRARIRLLLQRESQRGPSALEPGHRAAPGRIFFGKRKTLMFNGYAIRWPACTPAWTCGRITKRARRLSAMDLSRHIKWLKPPVFLLCLGSARACWCGRAFHDELGAEPGRIHHAFDRTWTLVFFASRCGHAAAQAAAPELADSLPAHVRPVRVFLRLACTS